MAYTGTICLSSLDGHVLEHRICESVIHSRERLTYEQAQEMIDGRNLDHELREDLLAANRLAIRMGRRRRAAGAVNFDLTEIRVVLAPDGTVRDIVPRVRVDAHRLIEEFMLLANRTIAEAMCTDSKTPFVSRLHDPPDREKIAQLASYIRPFGYNLPHKDGVVNTKDINKLLEDASGSPQEFVIQHAMVRSMSKARYGIAATGHFGLAARYYTHFTSPIRRYPDLIVHRLVKRKLGIGGPGNTKPPDESQLQSACDHLSERERVAVEAERGSVELKQVEYASNHLGKGYDGVITGVTRFGIFVRLSDLLVEGMVPIRDMDDDYYEYDERRYSLIGTRTGKKYRLGDKVRVVIAAARVESREIDLVLE